MQPRLGRRVATPGCPRLVGTDEGVLGAVLGRCSVAKDADQSTEDARVAVSIQPIEIAGVAGPIVSGHPRHSASGSRRARGPPSLCYVSLTGAMPAAAAAGIAPVRLT